MYNAFQIVRIARRRADLLTLNDVLDFLDALGYSENRDVFWNGMEWNVYIETENGVLLIRKHWGGRIDWLASR